jgi:hypothetical protein
MRYAIRAVITIAVVVFVTFMQVSTLFVEWRLAVPIGLFCAAVAAVVYLRTQSAVKTLTAYVISFIAVMLVDVVWRGWRGPISDAAYVFMLVAHYSLLLINLLLISKSRIRQRGGAVFVGIGAAGVVAVVVAVIEVVNDVFYLDGNRLEQAFKFIGYCFWDWIVPVGIAAYAFYRMHLSLRSKDYSGDTNSTQMTTLDSQF